MVKEPMKVNIIKPSTSLCSSHVVMVPNFLRWQLALGLEFEELNKWKANSLFQSQIVCWISYLGLILLLSWIFSWYITKFETRKKTFQNDFFQTHEDHCELLAMSLA